MKFISKSVAFAALAVALVGYVQETRAQGLFGRIFGGGQYYGGSCYSGQCYNGQCYGGSCPARACASAQCSRTQQTQQIESYEATRETTNETETFESDAPTPLGIDWDPLKELDAQVPACSPCQPVASCETCVNESAVPARKRPIAEGVRAAASAVAENAYLARVNAVRARYRLQPLALDSSLDYGCNVSVRNCAAYGRIYHAAGCGAEILASNYSRGIDGALNQWLYSSAHARLLLNPSYTRCGVQTYVDANGKNYCAMRFR